MNGFYRILTLLILTLILPGVPAVAATYYISPSGSDSNSGTSRTSPWQTLAKANATVFQPGDKIMLQAGAVYTGHLVFGTSDKGTATNPITVSCSGGQATIQPDNYWGILIYDTGGISVNHVNIAGNWSATDLTGNSGVGIGAFTDLAGGAKLNYLRIDHCGVSGCEWGGIELQSNPSDGSQSGFNDVMITNCVCHNCGYAGILTNFLYDPNSSAYAFSRLTVSDCEVYNIRGVQNFSSGSGDGIVLGGVNEGAIIGCVAHDNADLESPNNNAGPVGIWFWNTNDGIIEHCESYNNHTANLIDGDGFDLDGGCTNCTMEYNYSHNNDGAGFLLAEFSDARLYNNNTIRYNISENDARMDSYGGIMLYNGGPGISDCHIYNNTVYIRQPASHPVSAFKILLSTVSNIDIRNNIFFAVNGAADISAPPGQNDVLFQDNDYWAGGGPISIDWEGNQYSDLPSWRLTRVVMVGSKAVGLSIDPMLANPGNGGTIGYPNNPSALTAYKLMPSSPMIDAGWNLADLPPYLNVGTVDFYGVPIPQRGGYDIGASEYTKSAAK